MQYHTAAHVLAGLFNTATGALITGNQIGIEKTRFDFNLEHFDRSVLEDAINSANKVLGTDVPIKIYNLPREEAMKIPGIVKLANALPPDVSELRIVEIVGVDTQADGGCHVKNLLEVPKIELIGCKNKGKCNRRVYFKFKE